MSVSSVNSFDQMQQMQQLQALCGIQGLNSNSATSSLSTNLTFPASPDQANISKTGQLMSQLYQMSQNDPSQFSAVTGQISSELASQAQSCSDPSESARLTSFSQKFAQASQTGSMSALAPAHHGGRSHHASGTSGTSGTGAMSDVDSDIAQSLAALGSNANVIGSNAGMTGPNSALFSAIDKIIANDLKALGSNAGISGSASPGQLMSQLAQLQQSNPAQFKAVTQKIAQDLAAQASASSDPAQTKMLDDISEKFADASQTGSMSGLKPGHHGHHHHHGGGQTSAVSSEAQTDMQELAGLLAQDLTSASPGGVSNTSWSMLQGLGGSGQTGQTAYQNIGSILGSAIYK